MQLFNQYGDLHVQPQLLPSQKAFALRARPVRLLVKLLAELRRKPVQQR